MTREEELALQGWNKRTAADEPRLSELAGMYKEIGMEIHFEPFHPDEEKGCTECMKMAAEKYKTIYTRSSGSCRERILRRRSVDLF